MEINNYIYNDDSIMIEDYAGSTEITEEWHLAKMEVWLGKYTKGYLENIMNGLNFLRSM
jgi:hypothetical protein